MYTLKNIRDELKIKERYVSDLIRYIKTRTDDNPNYSLLLGAGCSITSGVRSAGQLINTWKKEVCEADYEEIIADEEIDIKINNQPWYNSRNPYSSLFEKRYDLPRQRRMFVEQEVRDKIPSIGYAYLTKLVENNYFKTIFTTNFDDLLNEAFYQYSIHRPLVCAHDSAINSITVTSKRAKIVKLHGDYLFDDIKSTLRETESLEENIKNKFIEFAKDYGLIIIGYAGNDRSVIDVITYLLKNEDYFKHGIYWCLREDSEINDDLKKLLWKDRVFYVKIDGFDELFAEFNSKLNSALLPVDSSFLNNRKKDILEKLTNNTYLSNTTCKYLNTDFKKINKTLEKDVVKSFLKYVTEKEEGEDEKNKYFERKGLKYNLTKEQELIFAEIQAEFFQEEHLNIIELVDKYLIKAEPNTLFHKGLLQRKAKSYEILNKKEEAILCYRKLLNLYNNTPRYYLSLINLLEQDNDKLELIDKAIIKYKYISRLYYEKAKLMRKIYEENILKEKLDFDLNDILILINKCIEIDPSIQNEFWIFKFSLLQKIYQSKTDELIKILEDFLK